MNPVISVAVGLDLRFRSVTHLMAEVGHTHNAVDQRLSMVVSAFQNTDTIQTPEAMGLAM